jgi:hypothetical protein
VRPSAKSHLEETGGSGLARLRTIARLLPSFIVMLFGLAILVGCTTEKKQKWLTFFFDGVPLPGGGTNAPVVVYDENGAPLDKVIIPHQRAGYEG